MKTNHNIWGKWIHMMSWGLFCNSSPEILPPFKKMSTLSTLLTSVRGYSRISATHRGWKGLKPTQWRVIIAKHPLLSSSLLLISFRLRLSYHAADSDWATNTALATTVLRKTLSDVYWHPKHVVWKQEWSQTTSLLKVKDDA